MDDLISIIVPIYKVEDYLMRCIESILKQTYQKFELILVNDGSPDKCGEICNRYAVLDNRIKVIHKKNGGLSDARNVGIDKATGNYITFVDSDDWLHEKYIEILYSLMLTMESDIVICDFIKASTHSIQVDIEGVINVFSNIEALRQFEDKYYLQMVIACAKLYKSELFKEIRFPYGRLHEDEFITYKVIFNANKIVLTTAQLYYYWQREDSITGMGHSLKSRMDVIDALGERADFFGHIGEIDLRNKTLKNAFYVYRTIYEKNCKYEKVEYKKKLKRRAEKLKKELRKIHSGTLYRMFFEIYFIMPKFTGKIFSRYRQLRKM